jgi:hypothetical protein
MCVALHPYLTGHPYRLPSFIDAVKHMTAHEKVWFATGAEIADWYYERHYDEVVAFLAGRRRAAAARAW